MQPGARPHRSPPQLASRGGIVRHGRTPANKIAPAAVHT